MNALDVARSSDPFRGILKKAASLRQGYGRQASCVLGLLACSRIPCTLRAPKALRPCWMTPRLREGMLFEHSPLTLNSPTSCLKRSKYLTQTSPSSRRSLISDRLLGAPAKIQKWFITTRDYPPLLSFRPLGEMTDPK